MATNSTNSVYIRHLLQKIKEMNSIQRKKSMPTVAFIFFFFFSSKDTSFFTLIRPMKIHETHSSWVKVLMFCNVGENVP